MTLKPDVNDNDHVAGNLSSEIVLVEYGDFECPYCGAAYPVVKDILKAMSIRFAFRNFPLSNSHPHARQAAEAAEAAALQGRFWEMHDLLFTNQKSLTREDLLGYARKLGLDVKRFENDMDSEDVAEKVQGDFMSGVRSGVNGTPTFFVNRERFNRPVGELRKYLSDM